MSRFLGEPEIRILDRAALEVLPAAPTPLHPGRIWIEAGELRIHGAAPFASTAYVDAHANRIDNPHAVTAAQTGAVRVTGDVMTGNLTAPDVGWGVGNSRGILLPEGDNLNNLVRAGWYDVKNAVNRPPVISGWTRIMVTRGHTDFFVHQLATDLFSDGMWHRRSIESPPGTHAWQPWQRIWHEGTILPPSAWSAVITEMTLATTTAVKTINLPIPSNTANKYVVLLHLRTTHNVNADLVTMNIGWGVMAQWIGQEAVAGSATITSSSGSHSHGWIPLPHVNGTLQPGFTAIQVEILFPNHPEMQKMLMTSGTSNNNASPSVLSRQEFTARTGIMGVVTNIELITSPGLIAGGSRIVVLEG